MDNATEWKHREFLPPPSLPPSTDPSTSAVHLLPSVNQQWHVIIKQSPWLTLSFLLSTVHPVSLRKCRMTGIYHRIVIWNCTEVFRGLKNPPCSIYSFPMTSEPIPVAEHFIGPTVSSFAIVHLFVFVHHVGFQTDFFHFSRYP